MVRTAGHRVPREGLALERLAITEKGATAVVDKPMLFRMSRRPPLLASAALALLAAFGASNTPVAADVVVQIVHAFAGGPSDGDWPGRVIRATNGSTYGTTKSGGPEGLGAVFEISPAGNYQLRWYFGLGPGSFMPANPQGIVEGPDHRLYGTYLTLGSLNCSFARGGGVFWVDPAAGSGPVNGDTYYCQGSNVPWGPAEPLLGSDGSLYYR